jgi:hypothetical protein
VFPSPLELIVHYRPILLGPWRLARRVTLYTLSFVLFWRPRIIWKKLSTLTKPRLAVAARRLTSPLVIPFITVLIFSAADSASSARLQKTLATIWSGLPDHFDIGTALAVTTGAVAAAFALELSVLVMFASAYGGDSDTIRTLFVLQPRNRSLIQALLQTLAVMVLYCVVVAIPSYHPYLLGYALFTVTTLIAMLKVASLAASIVNSVSQRDLASVACQHLIYCVLEAAKLGNKFSAFSWAEEARGTFFQIRNIVEKTTYEHPTTLYADLLTVWANYANAKSLVSEDSWWFRVSNLRESAFDNLARATYELVSFRSSNPYRSNFYWFESSLSRHISTVLSRIYRLNDHDAVDTAYFTMQSVCGKLFAQGRVEAGIRLLELHIQLFSTSIAESPSFAALERVPGAIGLNALHAMLPRYKSYLESLSGEDRLMVKSVRGIRSGEIRNKYLWNADIAADLYELRRMLEMEHRIEGSVRATDDELSSIISSRLAVRVTSDCDRFAQLLRYAVSVATQAAEVASGDVSANATYDVLVALESFNDISLTGSYRYMFWHSRHSASRDMQEEAWKNDYRKLHRTLSATLGNTVAGISAWTDTARLGSIARSAAKDLIDSIKSDDVQHYASIFAEMLSFGAKVASVCAQSGDDLMAKNVAKEFVGVSGYALVHSQVCGCAIWHSTILAWEALHQEHREQFKMLLVLSNARPHEFDESNLHNWTRHLSDELRKAGILSHSGSARGSGLFSAITSWGETEELFLLTDIFVGGYLLSTSLGEGLTVSYAAQTIRERILDDAG